MVGKEIRVEMRGTMRGMSPVDDVDAVVAVVAVVASLL